MIRVVKVSKYFGGLRAVDEVSIEISPGSITGLIGPNGAGKTTLFSLISRLYDTRVGKVAVLGNELRHRPGPALAAMGVVFQQPTLDLELTGMRRHDPLRSTSSCR